MLEVLVAFDRIRVTSNADANGILCVIHHDWEYYLEWRDDSFLTEGEKDILDKCIRATNGEEDPNSPVTRPFIIDAMQNAINFACITGVIGDDMSMTVLVTLKDGPPRIFHSLNHLPTMIVQSIGALVDGCEVEPERNGVAYLKTTVSPTASFYSLPPENDDDWKERVLEKFSRVTTFYADTANRILSLGKNILTDKPQLDGNNIYIENPWIEKKRVDLPPSRFSNRSVDDEIYARFKNQDGSLKNHTNFLKLCHCRVLDDTIRKELWLLFLNIRNPEMSDQAFKDHCEYLKREYLRITNELDSLGEETLLRIGKYQYLSFR